MKPEHVVKWAEVLGTLQGEGFLSGLAMVGEGVYKGYAPQGWRAAAREAAARLPGFTLPGNGVSWRMGQNAGGFLLAADTKRLRAVYGDYYKGSWQPGARDVLRDLLGYLPDNVHSVGTAARIIWAWVCDGQPDPYAKRLPVRAREETEEHYHARLPAWERTFAPGEEMQYHSCAPGIYPHAVLYDVDSYYATLLRLVSDDPRRSLRPRIDSSGEVYFKPWREGERDRLRDALAACWEVKTLRNALWGCALGSYKKQTAFTSAPCKRTGERCAPGTARVMRPVFGPGPFRPLALLVARTAKDLTAQQSLQANSVYGTVDSVVVTSLQQSPTVWQSYGLTVEAKHAGKADVLGRGAWAFYGRETGELLHATEPYRRTLEKGKRLQVPVGYPVPGKFHTLWL